MRKKISRSWITNINLVFHRYFNVCFIRFNSSFVNLNLNKIKYYRAQTFDTLFVSLCLSNDSEKIYKYRLSHPIPSGIK